MKKANIYKSNSLLLILALLLTTTAFTSCSTSERLQTDESVTYDNYVPPAWAPPYDGMSSVHYYYFPDYEMYYDVWDSQFWYMNNGIWASSVGLPSLYANINLYNSYVVLVNRNVTRPWMNHQYYVTNYPRNCYNNYKNIVVNNRIITNVAPNHELVPRAYNENNNRVTFMQHPQKEVNTNSNPPAYHHVTHEVPMKLITPSMPRESRNFNYGGGFRSRGRR